MNEKELLNEIMTRFHLGIRQIRELEPYEFEVIFDAMPEYYPITLFNLIIKASKNFKELSTNGQVPRKPRLKPILKNFIQY